MDESTLELLRRTRLVLRLPARIDEDLCGPWGDSGVVSHYFDVLEEDHPGWELIERSGGAMSPAGVKLYSVSSSWEFVSPMSKIRYSNMMVDWCVVNRRSRPTQYESAMVGYGSLSEDLQEDRRWAIDQCFYEDEAEQLAEYLRNTYRVQCRVSRIMLPFETTMSGVLWFDPDAGIHRQIQSDDLDYCVLPFEPNGLMDRRNRWTDFYPIIPGNANDSIMRLVQEAQTLELKKEEWEWVLTLAVECGWRPGGPEVQWKIETDFDYNRPYSIRDGRRVTDTDASALCGALETLLRVAPEQLEKHEIGYSLCELKTKAQVAPLVCKIMTLCRGGGFGIQ